MASRGPEVAAAYVRLRPDAANFKAEAQAELTPELRAIEQQIAAARASAQGTLADIEALKAARAGGSAAAFDLPAFTAKASAIGAVALEIGHAIGVATSRQSELDLVRQSLENAGKAWVTYGDDVTSALDKQRRESGFSLQEITQAFEILEQTIKDPAKALDDLAIAEDTARARGKDLAQVASSITQAVQGNVSNLNQLGVVTQQLTTRQDALKRAHAELLDSGAQLSHVEQQQYQDRLKAAQAADRQETAERALGELAKRNAGQSQAYLDSTAGSVAELKTSLTELQEQLGGPFLHATAEAAHGLSDVIRFTKDLGLDRSGLDILGGVFGDADTSAKDFRTTLGALQRDLATAKADVAGLNAEKNDALQSLITARQAQAEARAAVSADPTNHNRDALRVATVELADANTRYARAVRDAAQAEKDRASGTAAAEKDLRGLAGVIDQIAKQSLDRHPFGASTEDVDKFAASLRELAKQNPDLERQITDLAGIAEAAGKIPDDVTIRLTLDPRLDTTAFTNQVADQIAKGVALARTQLSAFNPLGRGGLLPPPKLDPFPNEFAGERGGKAQRVGAEVAETFSTSFVQHIDAGGISSAIADAIAQARGNITTESNSLADAVGKALDERLRQRTLPLVQEIQRIQGELDASSARSASADAANALSDAQRKLAELQGIYGPGKLTQSQADEIADAQRAVTDAQAQIQDQAKQARIRALQDQIDTQTTAEQARKDATSRSLADLADSFNRGQISQKAYLAQVRQVLADQQVSFKSAGALLGSAFADGFRDSLASLVKQVDSVLPKELRGASTTSTAANPRAAGAAALKSVLDQIATSGGKFKLDNVPKGLDVASLISAAKTQRAQDSYQTSSLAKQDDSLKFQGVTNDRLAEIAGLLRDGTHVTVTADGSQAKKKTRATAKATQS